MKSKSKPRTPPDLMNELLGSLQEDVALPGERLSEPTTRPSELINEESTKQLDDLSTSRLVDLSTRPQNIKAETRKRDGTELTRKTHYLTPEQVRRLKEYAFMTGQGESDVVRQALDGFFERQGHQVWLAQ